ncbi:MAG: DUF4189 domain-containing protein [Usitatibacteraceae bacterium]
MKKYAALLLSLGFLVHGSVFAIGAIAVDDSVGEKDPAWGISTGEDSEAAAKKSAMKLCKENGDNCKVVGWFKTCGAYASSRKYFGYGFGATKAIATSKALEMCGQNSCKVVTAECED